MNKVIGLLVLAAAVAAGAYYFNGTQSGHQAAQDAAKATSEAAKSATDAAKSATEAAKSATEAATDAAKSGAAAATEAATNAANSAVDAAKSVIDDASALTAEHFDADKVVAMIQNSSLAADTKSTLLAAVETARSNAALIPEVIAKVKAALGL